MKKKRLKGKTNKVIFYITILLCFTLVSCLSVDNTDYIENSLLEANNHILNEDFVKAIEIYDLILEKEPTNPKTLYNKAIVLNHIGKKDESLNFLDLLIQNFPHNIKAYELKIKFLKQENDFESVIDCYLSLLELNENLYDFRIDFIKFLSSLNEDFNNKYNDLIKKNALFLLNKNEHSVDALIALCTIENNNAEYSALLLLKDKKAWESIFSIKAED